MDSTGCTDGNRRCVGAFCRRSINSACKAYELRIFKALLRSFFGCRYAFLHFRRLLT